MRFGHIIHDLRVINPKRGSVGSPCKEWREKHVRYANVSRVNGHVDGRQTKEKHERERKPPERLHNTVDSESLSADYVANVRLRKRKQEKDTEWRRQRREDCDYREAEQLEDTERRRQRREDARKRRVTGTDAEYN